MGDQGQDLGLARGEPLDGVTVEGARASITDTPSGSRHGAADDDLPHVSQICDELGLAPREDDHRRVLAVARYLAR